MSTNYLTAFFDFATVYNDFYKSICSQTSGLSADQTAVCTACGVTGIFPNTNPTNCAAAFLNDVSNTSCGQLQGILFCGPSGATGCVPSATVINERCLALSNNVTQEDAITLGTAVGTFQNWTRDTLTPCLISACQTSATPLSTTQYKAYNDAEKRAFIETQLSNAEFLILDNFTLFLALGLLILLVLLIILLAEAFSRR